MIDVSARPMVERDILTLSIPFSVFLRLLENTSKSFLETESYKKVHKRIWNTDLQNGSVQQPQYGQRLGMQFFAGGCVFLD